ncbi:MAG: cysteine desulfurase [Patescibacteria group bacterium]
MLDPILIKKDFPILKEGLVYLDNTATSQKPNQVIEAVANYYREANSNVHRGIYDLAEKATGMYEDSRAKVAEFIGAPSAKEIIFTRNATEGFNLIAYTWGEANIGEGDEIIVTVLEHHSNLVPWQRLATKKKAKLVFWEPNEEGILSVDTLKSLITTKIKLLAMTHMSNVLGVITPVKEAAELIHQAGAIVVVDGAQSAPHIPINVQEMDCDFFVFSGHKMFAPMGIGVVWGREDILRGTEPFLSGGEMIQDVTKDGTTWNDLPWKFEAGTPNVGGVVGLAAAIDYINKIGFKKMMEYELMLLNYGIDKLKKIDNIKLFGPPVTLSLSSFDKLRTTLSQLNGSKGEIVERGPIISFALAKVHPHDLASILNEDGVAIRAGHHCAQVLMNFFKVPAIARASFTIYNTKEDLDVLAEGIIKAQKLFA